MYIGLGSNEGDRLHHLKSAIEELRKEISILKISSIYENPALLLPSMPSEWNKPFFNLVIKVKSRHSPTMLLKICKEVEAKLGRKKKSKWAPRIIDMDILLFDQKIIKIKHLNIPHPEIFNRDFVLTPLKEIHPALKLPKHPSTVLTLCRKLNKNLPCWMQVVNITPDSFSDGNLMNLKKFKHLLQKALTSNIHIIDLGAESTRPGAVPVSPEEEWNRLSPYIEKFFNFYKESSFRPRLSIDTYHVSTARKAINKEVDIINDVNGLSPKMLDLIKSSNVEYILMHSLNIPVDPKNTLSTTSDPVESIKEWLKQKRKILKQNKIDLNRIIFDPGIGFGKTAEQSLEILKRIKEFHSFPFRILVGHSRKSFMKNFSSSNPKKRDLESFGLSVNLAKQGVDILRVHEADKHARVFSGYSQLNNH